MTRKRSPPHASAGGTATSTRMRIHLASSSPRGVRDIVTTINYCRSKSIPIAVRGKGAHSPYGMANDAVVIDLMRMTAVRVDPEKKLAFVQAGADGGDSRS